MTKPTLTITPLKPTAPLAAATELHLLVSIACPPAGAGEAQARSRLNLALALDRSGSMQGEPLAEAKACAKRVAQSLCEGDRLSVVAYDNRVCVVVPPGAVVDKAAIMRAIDGITDGGTTNLHAGWLAAAEAAASGLSPEVLTRVMLLSDGQANQGVQDIPELSRQAAALADKGVGTSTIGLGREFNEDLMAAMAQAGQGQASYGETADDLWPSFEAELGLLSATCGKTVRLTLSSPCGGSVVLDNDFRMDGQAWILPNLAHGAEISALVRVSVSGLAGAGAAILEATVTHNGMDGAAAAPIAAAVTLPLVPFADFVIGVSDPKVAERVKEGEAATLQLQAKDAATMGNFDEVQGIAHKLAGMAGGNAWIAGMAETMGELAKQRDHVLLRKESTYASSDLRLAYASTAPAGAPEEAAFLRRRTRQGKKN